jgi:hypothetical protein
MMRALFLFAVPLFLASLVSAGTKADQGTTGAFILTASNKSVSAVNGKRLWIHPDGNVYLDAKKNNPPSSVELIAFLDNTKLLRIQQTVSGSSTGTEANLDFGT